MRLRAYKNARWKVKQDPVYTFILKIPGGDLFYSAQFSAGLTLARAGWSGGVQHVSVMRNVWAAFEVRKSLKMSHNYLPTCWADVNFKSTTFVREWCILLLVFLWFRTRLNKWGVRSWAPLTWWGKCESSKHGVGVGYSRYRNPEGKITVNYFRIKNVKFVSSERRICGWKLLWRRRKQAPRNRCASIRILMFN